MPVIMFCCCYWYRKKTIKFNMIKHINKSLLKITMRSVTVVNAVTYNFYAASAAAQHTAGWSEHWPRPAGAFFTCTAFRLLDTRAICSSTNNTVKTHLTRHGICDKLTTNGRHVIGNIFDLRCNIRVIDVSLYPFSPVLYIFRHAHI